MILKIMRYSINKVLVLIQFLILLFANQALAENNIETVDDVKRKVVNEIPYFSIGSILPGPDTATYSQIDIDQIADSLTQKVIKDNKIVDLLDPKKVYTLPIGIGKQIGGVYYIVVLDDLRFTTTGAVAKAYMSLPFPGSSKKIGLVADDVKISIDGIQAVKLKMLKDKPIDLLGNNSLLINADSTFVEWDCNGYKATQLSAKIELDPSVFYKENPSTRSIVTGVPVTGRVMCSVVDFNDILLSISVDPFQVKDLKDFSFYPKEIVLDMSDTRNVESMQFPAGYESALFDGANKNLWRGLYINSLTLKFPDKFAKSGPAPEVTVSRFLIDMEGITGSVLLNCPLLTLDQGNLGGWKFSVNSLSLSLEKNELSGFGMAGGILLPITEQNKPLSYQASIDGDKNFLFQVTLPGNINVPLFGSGSKLTIDSNSSITVKSKDGEFYPKAVLNGKLKIQVGGSVGASLADIDFQELTIQREDPRLDIKYLSLTSGLMSGFPVQIKKVALEKKSNDLGLLFDVDANLMQGKIEGETSFVIWATRDDNSWGYKDFELRRIKIDANTGAIKLKGELICYKNDQVYGNGYLGSVSLTVTPGIAVSAKAQFGNVNGLRYWYADASVILSTGIPIFTGFAIYGFGGGAYYHMQRNLPVNMAITPSANTDGNSTPGKTNSGITYIPTDRVSLGINAKVIIGTQPTSSAFNGSVGFGVEFTPSFGIGKVYFEGEAKFMSEITSDGKDAKVRAVVNIQYLVEEHELSGYSEAYINVAGAIKGAGSNNLAGRVEFYFAKSKWHIYVGTPTCPVGVTLLNVVTATSYFMVGTELPDFPPLPANLRNLSDKVNFTNMRSDNLTKMGGGFAFGASLLASTGEQKFLIFYGKFELGAGFDIMLKNFGNEARCQGISGSLGINGWYAQGQAWAFVDASIGVRVRVFGRTKKFSIMDAGFAAVMGAQLPNPTYLAGAVEAHFSVLGGLVKGKCHFEFSYGNQCVLVNASAVEGIKVIAEVTPGEDGKDVDVFITPQVAFNLPINQPFNVMDTDGQEKAFRVALDYFKILDNGQEITVTPMWNSTHDVLALKPAEVLPGQKSLKGSIKVHFQYFEGGAWQDYKVSGNVEGEEREVAFVTGVAPDYITENNVAYSYPVKNMVNFLKQEYGYAYIQLNQGVNYLFSKPGDWTYLARFTSGSNTLNMPITYNAASKRVELNVPASLINSSIYQMRILRVPSGTSSLVVDSNVKNNESNISDDQTVTTKQIEGTLTEEGTTQLYALHFRTSSYNTFIEKMSSLNVSYSRLSITTFIKQLHLNYKGVAPVYELFDDWELQNIKILALVDQTPWYANNYKDLLYNKYPLVKGMEIENRPVNTIGVPPVWVSDLVQYVETPKLSNEAITQGQLLFNSTVLARIEYNLCYYVSNDWSELRNRTFYIDPNSNNPLLNKIKESSYTGIYSSSTYPVKLMYYIPGQTTPTSEYSTPIYF